MRESEIAAESIGLNPYWVRTVAFTLGAAFAGAGGCLYASLAGFVSPDSFTMQTSILFLLVILFGGLGHVLGPSSAPSCSSSFPSSCTASPTTAS